MCSIVRHVSHHIRMLNTIFSEKQKKQHLIHLPLKVRIVSTRNVILSPNIVFQIIIYYLNIFIQLLSGVL